MADLNLYIDFKSPTAYLALQPTVVLLEALHPSVQWWPFKSNQRRLRAEKSGETRGETHVRVREVAWRATHLMYAQMQGMTMNFAAAPGVTDLALAALLYTRTRPMDFIKAAYHAYWVSQSDLNDLNVVHGLLADNGFDPAGFDPDHCLKELDTVHEQAQELGVVDAPAYVLQNNVFIGREHLPWIKTLLEEG